MKKKKKKKRLGSDDDDDDVSVTIVTPKKRRVSQELRAEMSPPPTVLLSGSHKKNRSRGRRTKQDVMFAECGDSPESSSPPLDDRLLRMFEFRGWTLQSRYKLESLAGKGSYGSVAICRDKDRSREKVAVKMIRNVFSSVAGAERVLRELRILRHLRGHPNIVEVFEVAEPEDRNSFRDLYVVFEAMDFDMSRLLDDRKQWITPDHTRYFLHQLLVGTSYMHSANIVHRDLKPANVLLRTDCTLKICDFGLARVISPKAEESITPSSPMTLQMGNISSPGSSTDSSLSPSMMPRPVRSFWKRAIDLNATIIKNNNNNRYDDSTRHML